MRSPLLTIAFIVTTGLAVGYSIRLVAIVAMSNSNALERERCKKFRREFFESCLAAEPRYRCEVQWAQLGGKVFDSDPAAPWSDQLDCSGVK